jgi:hypothetical protein
MVWAFLDKPVVATGCEHMARDAGGHLRWFAFRTLVMTSLEPHDHSAPSPLSPRHHDGGRRPLATNMLGV